MDQASLDRITELKAHTVKQETMRRLDKGAQVLGRLWRAGFRCQGGWKKECPCGADTTEFCTVKTKWLLMRMEMAPHPTADLALTGEEETFVFETMSTKQFEATGMTLKVEPPGMPGSIRFGAKGLRWKTLQELGALPQEERVEAWRAAALIDKYLTLKEPTPSS